MATVWNQEPLCTQQFGGSTQILGRVRAHLTLRGEPFENIGAARCSSSSRNPARSGNCMAGEGSSSESRRQEQELLWRVFFLDPTLWWDNRRDKKRFRSPDFRRKESGEVLWLNNFYKPAWVDEQLAALDMRMGRGARTSTSSLPDRPDSGRPARYKMGATAVTVTKICLQELIEAVEALELLAQTDCPISKSLFYTVLKQCVAKKDLVLGRRVHALTVKMGYESDTFLSNHILRMYASHARLQEAMDVFTRVATPDAFMWSSIISAHVKQGQAKQAILLYHHMCNSSVKPDGHVFVAALQACTRAADLETGQQVHADVLASGVEPDLFVVSCLVDMYAKCGSLKDAQRLFDRLPQKDVVTWTAMIAGYSQQGMGQEALHLYSAMQEEGIAVPDPVTFVCLLQACATVVALPLGKQLHAQIEERELQGDLVVGTSLVDMYAKCGSMVDAQNIFDALSQRDIVAWSALIAGYACQGDSQVVFALVHRMIEDDIQPDSIIFLGVLTACSHAGLVNKGQEYFEAMSSHYGIIPTLDHYTCMVDLLGRAGQLDEALEVVKAMPVEPDDVVWHTLLGACRKWRNVEVGRYAFEQAVKLDERDAAAYVVMSNIYTGAQMWEEAQEIKARRIKIGAWKQPGESWWTDLSGRVHTFWAGE